MNDIAINPPRRTPPVVVEAGAPAQVTATVARGRPGEPGQPGIGVPAGGTTGQVLTKTSGADYATGWANVTSGAQQVYVQPTNPNMTEPGIWIQTGLAPGGTGFTFWFEDGL